MYSLKDLKTCIMISDVEVECPVKDCTNKVPRQSEVFRRGNEFKCPVHDIYISPSTFEYHNELDNLLWKDEDLLGAIKKVKRESRMTRDNSEDALTWNVFRYLEKSGNLDAVLSSPFGFKQKTSEVVYWSYSQKDKGKWVPLEMAREFFGEKKNKGSEPDIIIKTDTALFIIEAKLNAGNKTMPSNEVFSERYETNPSKWFWEVFKATSNYRTVAIAEKKYELMRFWLLGTWIANELGLDFYLVNLVPSGKEENVEAEFDKHIIESSTPGKVRQFVRSTWEDIYWEIMRNSAPSLDREKIKNYFLNKSIGYDGNGHLRKAFKNLL